MIVLPTFRWPDEEMEVEVQKQLQNFATLNEGLTSTEKDGSSLTFGVIANLYNRWSSTGGEVLNRKHLVQLRN